MSDDPLDPARGELERQLDEFYRKLDGSARRVEARWKSTPVRSESRTAAWLGAGVAAAAAILLVISALRSEPKRPAEPAVVTAPTPIPEPAPAPAPFVPAPTPRVPRPETVEVPRPEPQVRPPEPRPEPPAPLDPCRPAPIPRRAEPQARAHESRPRVRRPSRDRGLLFAGGAAREAEGSR